MNAAVDAPPGAVHRAGSSRSDPSRRAASTQVDAEGDAPAFPPAPDPFVPRGDEKAALAAVLAETRKAARRARLRHLVAVGGGWFMAGVMGCVAASALALVWHRPAPKDRLAVAFVTDGVYEAPVLREDLPKSRREVLLRHSALQYLYGRENYSWESVQANYNRVSAMSAPAEQARYQKTMTDPKDPQNPANRYGSGIGAGTAVVTRALIQEDRATPNALVAVFYVRERLPNQPPREVRKIARMSWMDAQDKIPLAIQQQFDPAGIAFTHYDSDLDPEAKPQEGKSQ